MGRTLFCCLFASAVFAAEIPSPGLLVLNKSENSLAIVDPVARKVLGRVPTGESPHEVTTDGKFAYVANYATPTISVIDLAARSERKVDLAPLSRPHGIDFSGGKVYFTAEPNRIVARFDPASSKIDWAMGTGQSSTHMVLVNNGRIVTANIGSDSISVIEGPNVTTIPVGKGPEGFDISPDGSSLWTAHSRDGGVSVIDLAAKKVVHTIDLGTKRSNRLKFTPDGKRVLVSDMGGDEVVVIDAAARKPLRRLKLGRQPEGIQMEPGGKHAYVAISGEDRIAILDLNSLEATGKIETGRGPDGMAWIGR